MPHIRVGKTSIGSNSFQPYCTPRNVVITSITGGNRITFTQSCPLTETEIWASIDGGVLTLITTLAPGVETYDHTGLDGVDVDYQLRSKLDTTVLSGIPTVTSDLITGGVRLTISPNNAEADNVQIWVKIDAAEYVLLATALITGVSFTYDHTIDGATVIYKVRAIEGTLPIYSSYSEETTEIVPAAYPAILDDANTVGWFIASDLTTITKDAGTGEVSQWNDQNGTGHNLLQSNATRKPIWSSDGILLDGINDYMKASAFTFNQPEYVYIVLREPTINNGGRLFDGNATNSGGAYHGAANPAFLQYAGSAVNNNTAHQQNTWEIIRVFFNGAASKTIVNATTVSGGNAGAANMGGFTLGDAGGIGAPSNIQVKELILRKIDDTADGGANETAIYNYLKAKYSL